jgi:TonB family protein
VLEGPEPSRRWPVGPFFRDAWIRSPVPKRAMAASVFWHVLLLFVSIPLGRLVAAHPPAIQPHVEITWYGPARDLAPLVAPGPAAKPSPPGEPNKPLPPRGADAFHPRQTVLSIPKRPTHPRQTLIQPDAPAQPPKLLPALPNVVQWDKAPQPARPRLPIDPAVLARLHPKLRAVSVADVPVPELPNQEPRPAELNIAASTVNNPQPSLPMNPSSVAAPEQRHEAVQAAPAPDIGASSGDASLQRLISLSTTPGAPVPPPPGNVAATLTISPEGIQPGVPGGSPNGTPGATGSAGGGPGSPGGTGGSGGSNPGTGGGGKGIPGPPGLTISGGDPNGSSTGGNGLGSLRAANPVPATPLPSKPEPRLPAAAPSRTPIRPALDQLPPGEPAEEILGPKRVYTLYVNMPNLTSVTGSWVLNFAELADDPQPKAGDRGPADLAGPVPLRKVDPRYPPELISAHVEGEVILYAIIRGDGSVDSIRILRSVDPQLDENAMQALARWKFRPGTRHGAPVELEAVIHIPFRAVAPSY